MTIEQIGTSIAILITLANFAYLIVSNRGKDVWKLSDRLNKLDTSRAEFREHLLGQVDVKCSETVNQFGETMKSQAEHTRLLELEIYKNFVRIDTFKDSMALLTTNMTDRLNRIDKRLDTIESLIRHDPKL